MPSFRKLSSGSGGGGSLFALRCGPQHNFLLCCSSFAELRQSARDLLAPYLFSPTTSSIALFDEVGTEITSETQFTSMVAAGKPPIAVVVKETPKKIGEEEELESSLKHNHQPRPNEPHRVRFTADSEPPLARQLSDLKRRSPPAEPEPEPLVPHHDTIVEEQQERKVVKAAKKSGFSGLGIREEDNSQLPPSSSSKKKAISSRKQLEEGHEQHNDEQEKEEEEKHPEMSTPTEQRLQNAQDDDTEEEKRLLEKLAKLQRNKNTTPAKKEPTTTTTTTAIVKPATIAAPSPQPPVQPPAQAAPGKKVQRYKSPPVGEMDPKPLVTVPPPAPVEAQPLLLTPQTKKTKAPTYRNPPTCELPKMFSPQQQPRADEEMSTRRRSDGKGKVAAQPKKVAASNNFVVEEEGTEEDRELVELERQIAETKKRIEASQQAQNQKNPLLQEEEQQTTGIEGVADIPAAAATAVSAKGTNKSAVLTVDECLRSCESLVDLRLAALTATHYLPKSGEDFKLYDVCGQQRPSPIATKDHFEAFLHKLKKCGDTKQIALQCQWEGTGSPQQQDQQDGGTEPPAASTAYVQALERELADLRFQKQKQQQIYQSPHRSPPRPITTTTTLVDSYAAVDAPFLPANSPPMELSPIRSRAPHTATMMQQQQQQEEAESQLTPPPQLMPFFGTALPVPRGCVYVVCPEVDRHGHVPFDRAFPPSLYLLKLQLKSLFAAAANIDGWGSSRRRGPVKVFFYCDGMDPMLLANDDSVACVAPFVNNAGAMLAVAGC